MARRYQERRVFPQSQSEVVVIAERAVAEVGLKINGRTADHELKASKGIQSGSWGERIRFQLATFPGGGTQVIIESRLVFGLFDWGRNRENVEGLFRSMEVVLGPGRHRQVEP